jgi:hypothetical protein
MKNSVIRSGKQWYVGYQLLQKATTKLKRRAAIEGGERATKSIIRGVANREAMEKVNIACKVIPFPGNMACFASTSAWFLLIYGMETWMTYLPIMHFIERSQDATNAINEGWASASCISKPEKVIITKPNCGSEAVLDYPDFDPSGSILTAWIEYVPFLEKIAEASFAMPFSKLTTEIKTYEGIETDEEICVDYHNYLLSTEAQGEFFGIDGEYINPKNAVGRIPYGACLLTGLSGAWFGFSQWGVGCTSMYGILYLSNWIDPEMGHATKLSLIGVAGVFGGPIGGAALYSAFMYNPHDSTTFFPYISQSAGMIDTDNYYYMENPYLISVSKEYKDGEYVTEISKEL